MARGEGAAGLGDAGLGCSAEKRSMSQCCPKRRRTAAGGLSPWNPSVRSHVKFDAVYGGKGGRRGGREG